MDASDFVTNGKKIVGVGLNYKSHAAEMGIPLPPKPLLFLKPTTAYITEGQAIKLPRDVEVHHEVELAVVIGKEGKNIPESQAMDHVAGYACGLDMTNRTAFQEAMKKGLPQAIAKGFDTSCPISKFIPKKDIEDPDNVELWLKVNGDEKQRGFTNDMVFTVAHLISYISSHFTLQPNDVILTGTLPGLGLVKHGDKIECGITGKVAMAFMVEDS